MHRRGHPLVALALVVGLMACSPAPRATLPAEAFRRDATIAPRALAQDEAGAPQSPPPAVLAEGLALTGSALVLDATSLYWIDHEKGLSRASRSGGAPVQLWADASNARHVEEPSIAVDDANIYFTFDTSDGTEPGRQSLVRHSKRDGSTKVLVQLEGQSIASVVVDEPNIYWVQSGSVMRAAKQGGRAARIASGAAPLAIDEARVYWLSHLADSSDRFVIRAAPKTGGTASVVVNDVERASTLMVDGTHVYWTSNTKLLAASKTGGAPFQLAEAKSRIGAVAMDATHVYFVVPGDRTSPNAEGTVWRVTKDGSTPTLLATDRNHPTGIAVDSDSVYWASSPGALAKLEKSR